MTGYATITAWSTPQSSPQTNSTTSPTDTGIWLPAYLAIYGSNGIGISNTQQGAISGVAIATETYAQLTCATGCPTTNPEHVGNAPQHAIDNNGVDDILVVDFGSTGWDVNSFSLGYTCNASTGASAGTVAVEAWLGGASGTAINFATEKFSTDQDLNAVPIVGGFTRLTLNNDPSGVGTITAPSTTPTGRYLVLTGALGAGTINGVAVNGYSDAFKVSQIVASQTTVPPSVPIPGSLPLIALGLVALRFARRRFAPIA